MTLRNYLLELSHPVAYYRVDKSVVNDKIDYFTKMFNCKISCAMAIILIGSEIEELLK